MKKVFAPGATPEPGRVYRSSIAQATPRGLAAKTTAKDLFPMRIASPPPELTGEALTQKVPREWNSKGSIYADQFLAHLCPPELDEEQRRQFFCILDLRRLKYAANEIFARKDWKLNVINFAKEFEKSRSIILLRYGLYEFQNVKPSKDVLKRWRREHGLPEPEDEEDEEATPSKPTASKKRKAVEDHAETSTLKGGKRRAVDDESGPVPAHVATTSTPAVSKHKRKASVSEEQPAKMQKSTPSSAKSLFEKIANKPRPAEEAAGTSSTPKPNPFGANKPTTSSSLARSVFTSLKPPGGQAAPGAGGNIFGYLSDASSAKNSGVDADAESESDSEQDDSQEAGQSDGPSVAASGAGDIGSQIGASMFGKKSAPPTSGLGVGLSSAPDTEHSGAKLVR
jgi:tubulin gamma